MIHFCETLMRLYTLAFLDEIIAELNMEIRDKIPVSVNDTTI